MESAKNGFYGRFSANGNAFGGFVVEDKVYEVGKCGVGAIHNLADVTCLPPVEPSQIVCIGLNYAGHAKDIGRPVPTEPLLFLKALSTLAAHEETVVLPSVGKVFACEGELVIIMGKEANDVSEDEALDYVFGYTCGNDLAARDLQSRDGQWMRGKSLRKFAPMGPLVRVGDIDPDNLHLVTRVNGKVCQDTNTSDLVFGCKKLVSYVSKMMPLHPGDVIMTGTPSGAPEVKSGDVIEVEIEGIGTLRNKVIAE